MKIPHSVTHRSPNQKVRICQRKCDSSHVPRTPIDDDVAFVRLLAEEGVLTVPGSGFGMPGHIRISLTVERETVVRALPGFERAFHKARA